MSQPTPKPSFVYFGGEPIGVPVLEELAASDMLPSLIVCNPDRPSGRGNKLTPPPVKIWAESNGIQVWQPDGLPKTSTVKHSVFDSSREVVINLAEYDLFVVVAYNKIMPKWLIELPPHKTINVHPSLLPKLRGMSPIRTAILEDKRADIGVSIMLMDEEMDHGPLLAQMPMPIADEYWPIVGPQLDEALAHMGGALLADTISRWVAGDITPQAQDHDTATFTKKITKADGELEIDITDLPTGAAARQMLLRIRGLAGWPGTYFHRDGVRVKINAATIHNDRLVIENVTPAGKRPMDWETFYHANV